MLVIQHAKKSARNSKKLRPLSQSKSLKALIGWGQMYPGSAADITKHLLCWTGSFHADSGDIFMFALILKSLKSVYREAHSFHALWYRYCACLNAAPCVMITTKRSAGMSTNRSWWMQSGHVWKLQFKAQISTPKQNIWIASCIISHCLLERELGILVKQCCHRSGGFCWPIFIRLLRKRQTGRTGSPVVISGCRQVIWIFGHLQLSQSKHLTCCCFVEMQG